VPERTGHELQAGEENPKEVCQNWSADTRNPANDSIAAGGDDNQVTDFSSSNRHHRGVRERTRVRENQYYNSSWGENNPSFNANALFGGAMVGTYPQQGKYAGRDGLPRNSRREVIECPHMGVSSCLSAIFAAETSCNPTLHHRGHGYGLCAIENDGRRKRFGAACDDIRSTSGQITCCQAILDQQGSKYFGGRTKRIAGVVCGWR